MQDTSYEWRAAQKLHFTPESFVEIQLNVLDPDAQLANYGTDNDHTDWSNVYQVADETEKEQQKYQTVEHNQFILDGTTYPKPDNGPYGNQGYNGTVLCNADGVFEDLIPTVELIFDKVFTDPIAGITINWGPAYDECADTYRVIAYGGDEVVADYLVEGNTEIKSVMVGNIEGYDKIVIEVHKWCLPYRRARIQNVLIGIQDTFTKEDFIEFKNEMSVDPLSASLPKNKVKFELDNVEQLYNPENPEGIAKYLLERQEIVVKYGYKLGDAKEWIKGGTYYLSEWEAPQNGITVEITARDSLEFMDDVYTGPITGTLMSIAEAAFEQANLPVMRDGSNRWYLDDGLADISTNDGIKNWSDNTTIAQTLQYVANAACMVFYQDRDGLIHIEPLSSPVAQISGTVQDNGHEFYSDVATLADGSEKEIGKYAVLDRNMWTLDGTLVPLENKSLYEGTGFISKYISGDDSAFEVYPTITVSFPVIFTMTVPGLTITWSPTYGECARKFRITAYNGSEKLDSITVEGNTETKTFTNFEMKYFDTVTLEILEWSHPNRRARIEDLLVGIESQVYDINQFNSYETSDIELSTQLKAVKINNNQYTLTLAKKGNTQSVSNPLISDAQAPKVAQWIADYLQNRKTLSGDFRVDCRLDPLDRVFNTNKYARNTVLVTDVTFKYNGAFKGSYEGRADV